MPALERFVSQYAARNLLNVSFNLEISCKVKKCKSERFVRISNKIE